MNQAHWLARTKASMLMARNASSAEARLIHMDLAGRYSVKAVCSGDAREVVTLRLPRPNGNPAEVLVA